MDEPRNLPRNRLKERVAPGIWIDEENNVHWSIPELLKLVDLPDTPENRAHVLAIVQNAVRRAAPKSILIERSKPD